jgi:hypothetical protein
LAATVSVSAEREIKRLDTRIQKLDLELPIHDRLLLSDELIHALPGGRSVALLVNIKAVRPARRPSVDGHTKSHWDSSRRRTHDEMHIAGVKSVRDSPTG